MLSVGVIEYRVAEIQHRARFREKDRPSIGYLAM